MGAVAVTVPADAARLLAGGGLALLPTDTVYGIACAAADVAACRRLYALKQRPATQATAAVLGSVPALLALLPEMSSRASAACRVLLPGPYTLIVSNPAGRLAHLCGDAPERIGLRVPLLDPGVADLADGGRRPAHDKRQPARRARSVPARPGAGSRSARRPRSRWTAVSLTAYRPQ